VNHTDCGMLTFTDENLRKRLLEKYDADVAGLKFYSFTAYTNLNCLFVLFVLFVHELYCGVIK
jgi:hypothetical protein